MSEQATPENSSDEGAPGQLAGHNAGAGSDDLAHGGPTEQEPPPTQTEDERHGEHALTDPSEAELGAED